MVFLVITGVIALAIVGLLASEVLERKRDQRWQVQHMRVFRWEPTYLTKGSIPFVR